MQPGARAVLACLLVPAAAAVGQLVTPPPEHAPRPEDHIAIAGFGRELREPDLVKEGIERYFGHPPAPILAFKSLVQRDANGNVTPLREPIEWAALRNNPLVTPGDLARIEPELGERRRIIDRIVTENLDLAEQIDEGLFENINLANNQGFTKLMEVSRPFRQTDLLPMSGSLVKKGLLSTDQQALNDKITREYKLATMPQTPPGGNPQQKAEAARRSLALVYKQGLDEPLFELRRMRLAVARSLPKAIPSLNLDGASAAAVGEVADRMRPEDDEQTTLHLMSQINASLTLEQRKELLRVGARRE